MKKLLFLFVPCMVFLFSCATDSASGSEQSPDEVASQPAVDLKAKTDEVKKEPVNAIPDDTVNVARIAFNEESYNFGTIDEGETVEHVFKFKNTGKEPLVISNARGSCGCTVPEWPKEPIAVGETGEMKVRFNSKGKKNKQKKTVTVTANTWPTQTRIFIEGQVTPAPVEEAAAGGK